MKKTVIKKNAPQICPKCGKEYTEPPALSREDNATLLCPDCGCLQALASLGIDEEEQQHILALIHNAKGK